jgi:hypothetical protein
MIKVIAKLEACPLDPTSTGTSPLQGLPRVARGAPGAAKPTTKNELHCSPCHSDQNAAITGQ